MERPDPKRAGYLGMAKQDLDNLWYAKYWNPQMKKLPTHITEALIAGPQASQLLPSLNEAAQLAEPGYQQFENGFGIAEDGAAIVAALTHMPNVIPAMWDWWFGWHGCDSRRYKLWNPEAHLYACWKDGLTQAPGSTNREAYLNRTSFIDEFVGSTKLSLALQFVSPTTFGFDEKDFMDDQKSTIICARVGLSEVPIDSGYLIHQIRRINSGSEMRSRFWLGGKYISLRDSKKKPSEQTVSHEASMIWQAYSLLVHCAKEMNHLAAFMPTLYQEYLTDKSAKGTE